MTEELSPTMSQIATMYAEAKHTLESYSPALEALAKKQIQISLEVANALGLEMETNWRWRARKTYDFVNLGDVRYWAPGDLDPPEILFDLMERGRGGDSDRQVDSMVLDRRMLEGKFDEYRAYLTQEYLPQASADHQKAEAQKQRRIAALKAELRDLEAQQ